MSEIANKMAQKQREISVSEFFTKNRHLLGFDNPRKSLLTTIKEAVDNSLDACEEARIMPDILVQIIQVEDNIYRAIIEDNGPGILKTQIPNIFGKLLYGSKFHTLKMSRGQQGIGISAAGMYGQLTTGHPVKITSKISSKTEAQYVELLMDTQKNKPELVVDKEISWEKEHGTRIEIEMEAKYTKGKQSVDDYLMQTAVANPHVKFTYITPDSTVTEYPRCIDILPKETIEIKPHPHGVELGFLIKLFKTTSEKRLKACLMNDFSRISAKVAENICKLAGIRERINPAKITRDEADKLFKVIQSTKLMKPQTDCISPIGEEAITRSLEKMTEPEFVAVCTRPPAVYRGNPFQVEAGIAYGKRKATKVVKQMDLLDASKNLNEEEIAEVEGEKQVKDDVIQLLRFANRVPLQYQQSACAINKSVVSTSWNSYGLSQSRGALPVGPVTLMIHIGSVWVPFTSESKEAIAHYPEIIKEIKLALQESGRKLGQYLRKKEIAKEKHKKKSYITKYLPHISGSLQEILRFTDEEELALREQLKILLEKGDK